MSGGGAGAEAAGSDVARAADVAATATTVPSAAPVLRIVRGVPAGVDASVEVAVLTAVLLGRSGGVVEPPAAPVSEWAARERLVRRPVAAGPHGWWSSGLPR